MAPHVLLRTFLAALLVLPLCGASGTPVVVSDPAGDERVTLFDQRLSDCHGAAADLLSYATESDGDNLTVRILRARADAPLVCAGLDVLPPTTQAARLELSVRWDIWASTVYVSVEETPEGTRVCQHPPMGWTTCAPVEPGDVRDGDAWVLTLPLHGTSATVWGGMLEYDLRGGAHPAFVSARATYGASADGHLVAVDSTERTPLAL